MKKYCTKCGHEFEAVGREVICPSCKAQAAEETKRAAVERAKRASWTGESVPVRISGRASTVIRAYGKHYSLPFARALDALLQASDYVKGVGCQWDDIKPYKSHRRDKTTSTAEDETDKQDTQDVPQDTQDVKQAAKAASKATASKTSASKASKAKASKTVTSKSSKASRSVSTK